MFLEKSQHVLQLAPSVVYGPSPSLDEPTDTEALSRAFARLREMAFSEAESRKLLEQAPPRSCVMRDTGWFKSSFSAGASDNCVEVRRTPHATAIRDAKNPAAGGLTVDRAAWAAFVRRSATSLPAH